MKERSFVSAFALGTSLGAYYLAKTYQKDTAPLVMIGGFFGALVGEIILEAYTQNNTPQKHRTIKKQKQIKK